MPERMSGGTDPEPPTHPQAQAPAPGPVTDPDPWPWSDDREARELDAAERAYERYIGRT